MAHPSGAVYRIACLSLLLAQLRTWGAAAIDRGEGAAYTEALKFINQRLTTDPASWGDPLYPLRKAGLTMYRGLRSPLQVHYAVDETRRLVFVKAFTLVFGFGGQET